MNEILVLLTGYQQQMGKFKLIQISFQHNIDIVIMLPQKLSPHQINSYLSSKNFNLSSDKIFKQQSPNSDTVWSILTFLCQQFPNKNYEQIQPMLVYLLEVEVYGTGLKKLKEYILVSTILSKLMNKNIDETMMGMKSINNWQYPFKQILKPEKDTVIDRVSILISFNKYFDRMNKKFDEQFFQQKMLTSTARDYHRKYSEVSLEIQQMKTIKSREKQYCEQKVKSIQAINKEISYKKKQKLDLLNSQQELNNQLHKKKKMIDESAYEIDDCNLQIKRLERQVIQNAPRLKKERMNIMQEYQIQRDSLREKQRIWGQRVHLIRNKLTEQTNIKNRSPTFRIQQLKSSTQAYKRNLKNLQFSYQTNQQSISHKNQHKINLITKLQSYQAIDKPPICLQIQNIQDQVSYHKNSIGQLNQQLHKYSRILQKMREKMEKQKAHEQQLQQRFFKKKKIFLEEIQKKKSILRSLKDEAFSIIKQSFEGIS